MLAEVPVSAFEKPGRDYLQPTVGSSGQDVEGALSHQREGTGGAGLRQEPSCSSPLECSCLQIDVLMGFLLLFFFFFF